MKKGLLICCLALILVPVFAGESRASVDLSIGANVWYCWWKPPWENISRVYPLPYPQNRVQRGLNDCLLEHGPFTGDPAFMYGPALSVRFLGRWTLGAVFYYGYYKYTFTTLDSSINNGNLFFNGLRIERWIKKYDGDINCSYQALPFMKVFLGYKVMAFYYKERYMSMQPASYGSPLYSWEEWRARSLFYNMGPGLGVSFNVKIVADLYLIGTMSGMILWGKEDRKTNYNASLNMQYPRYGYFMAYGGNASVSLAYYIAPASLTVMAGGRYQILRYRDKVSDRGSIPYDGTYDHFYGATMSVTYTFSFGKKKEES